MPLVHFLIILTDFLIMERYLSNKLWRTHKLCSQGDILLMNLMNFSWPEMSGLREAKTFN